MSKVVGGLLPELLLSRETSHLVFKSLTLEFVQGMVLCQQTMDGGGGRGGWGVVEREREREREGGGGRVNYELRMIMLWTYLAFFSESANALLSCEQRKQNKHVFCVC